jgi:hypothetical protein
MERKQKLASLMDQIKHNKDGNKELINKSDKDLRVLM